MIATCDTFKALQGIETPVSKVLEQLSAMWEAPLDAGASKPPSEYRASRMNLILHIGLDASVDEAKTTFRSVIDFSRRYPCRVLALCAQEEAGDQEGQMACKIYSECYIGKSRNEMSCCEAIILGYPMRDRQYLENQVSIFLESDLPTYYWPYRFDSPKRLSDYQVFFKESQRIVFDSARESFSPEEIDLPEPAKLHDLSYSRLLSIRQCIGQFLSAFPPARIVDGLEAITFRSGSRFSAEGRALLKWLEGDLSLCYEYASVSPSASFEQDAEDSGEAPSLEFRYTNDNGLNCSLHIDSNSAHIKANIGGESHSMTAAIRLLDSKDALAEALFFD